MSLTCPNCGNDQNFLVKTLQMHVVHLDDSRVEVSEEGRPAVLEVLCDECETALNLEEMDEALRKELDEIKRQLAEQDAERARSQNKSVAPK